MNDSSLSAINEKIIESSKFIKPLKDALNQKILGQEILIDKILVCMLANGHLLLEGVPGLAKTLTVKTISELIDSNFQRIQFTPDMLPADLIGTLIFNQKTSQFETRKGPIFSNIILADEINRSPAKVQSALLECMQERSVTIGEESFELERPFLVMATQNPIDQEGTYPLPEAPVDRFMFKLIVSYPDKNSEKDIIRANVNPVKSSMNNPIISGNDIIIAQNLIKEIYVDEKIEDYVLNLIFATRDPKDYKLNDLIDILNFGASPRASINLIRAAKSKAFMENRGYVTPEDIRYIGKDILRHRIILTYEAEAEEISTEDVITRIFEVIEVP